jgi:hypothetical protein
MRGLARDGYVISWDEQGRATLRAALPAELELPAIDDEVHQLLKHFQFQTPLGHLDQAIEAHTRGDWAAANGQLRTFLESLFDGIAQHIKGLNATRNLTSENRRALLANIGFLATDRNEWSQDGKNYINGLFKMLHTEGSHPGLSDEDHCTFRLHVVLVTARTFLRRLRYSAHLHRPRRRIGTMHHGTGRAYLLMRVPASVLSEDFPGDGYRADGICETGH